MQIQFSFHRAVLFQWGFSVRPRTIFNFFFHQNAHTYRGAIVAFRYLETSVFSREVSFYLIAVYCGCFGFSMALFGVQFIYRYGVVQKSFYQKYLSGKKVYTLFIIPLVFGVWWTAIIIIFYHFNDETDNYMRNTIYSNHRVKIEDVSYNCLLFYHSDESVNPTAFWGISGMMIMMVLSIFSVIYFGLKCYFEISKMLVFTRNVSYTTKTLQEQFFRALVAQTCIPFILMYIPAGILFTFPMLHINLNFSTAFVAYTIAFYPVIDPIPTMLIIKNYRTAVISFFGGEANRSRTGVLSTTPITLTEASSFNGNRRI